MLYNEEIKFINILKDIELEHKNLNKTQKMYNRIVYNSMNSPKYPVCFLFITNKTPTSKFYKYVLETLKENDFKFIKNRRGVLYEYILIDMDFDNNIVKDKYHYNLDEFYNHIQFEAF